MSRFIVAALLISVATPTFAAEFYVTQDPTTKRCNVSSKKPDGKTWVMVGTEVYATKEEAKAAKKANPDCKPREEKRQEKKEKN